MISLCFRILKKKRKDTIIVVLAVFILSLISVVATTICNDIVDKKRDEAFDTYGDFIKGGVAKKEDQLPSSSEIKVGKYKTVDFYIYNDKAIPIGTADENFFELESCTIIDGKWPEKQNEIAVESFVASCLNKRTGDFVDLSINGVQEKYCIVGVLNNYSMTKSLYVDDMENTVYPSIIIGRDYNSNYDKQPFIIGFSDKNEIGFDDISVNKRLSYYVDNDLVFFNDNLFFKGLMYCAELENYANVFNVIIFLLTCLILAILYRFFFKNLRREFAVFTAMGGEAYIKKLTVVQTILVTSASFILSVIVYTVISLAVLHLRSSSLVSGFGFLGVWYAVYIICIIVMNLLYYTIVSRRTVRENLTNSGVVRKSGTLSYLFTTIKYLIVFIITFLCILFVNVVYESFVGIPDYQFISKEAEVSELIKGYEIRYNTIYAYDISAVNDILNKYSNIIVELKPNIVNNMLVYDAKYSNEFLTSGSEYFSGDDITAENSFFVNNWPEEANDYIPIENVQYLVLSGEEYKNVMDNIGAAETENNVLLYVPTADAGIEKERLGFVGFIKDDGVDFKKYDISVDDIIYKYKVDVIKENTKAYSVEMFNPHDSETIYVLLDYDKMSDYPIVNGYDQVYVTLGDDFQEYDEIDDDMAYLQSGIQGGVMYSRKEDERKAKSYNDYVKGVTFTLISITVAIAVIYSLCAVILYIKNNRKRLGIMMVMGRTTRKICSERALSNIWCFVTAVLGGSLIIALFVYNGDNGLPCLTAGGIASGIAVGIMLIDDIIFNSFFKRVKIKTCIYK